MPDRSRYHLMRALMCISAGAAAIPLFFWRNVSAVEPASSQLSLAEMDKMSGVKGWNFAFPSFGDTLTQDYGGWRSKLASAGIGLIHYNLDRFQANLLNTPHESPRFNPFFDSAQIYWGQKPSFSNGNVLVLTYDLSRFGVPDGQLQSCRHQRERDV
jgi:porin